VILTLSTIRVPEFFKPNAVDPSERIFSQVPSVESITKFAPLETTKLADKSHTPVDSFFKMLTLLIALFTVVRCVVEVQLTVMDLLEEL
ncbi:MAG: hypothetical protein WBP88_13615, partial [Nitrososphaeraceae archaeon]